MNDITIHRADSNDFSASGLGLLRPLDMTVSWVLNGMYQLDATFALNDPMAALLEIGAVIVAPVPAQETPSLSVGASESEARKIYRVATNGGRLRLRSGPGTGGRILDKYKNGTEVVLLDDSDADWFRVAVPDGASGYMSAAWLKYVRTETQTAQSSATSVVSPKPVRRQPFRISRIDPGILTVAVHARHIFFDLSDNLLLPRDYGNITRQSAMQAFLTQCLDTDHGFTARCEGAETAALELTEAVSVAAAITGSDGLIDRLGGELMADWYDVYIVDRLGRDRGVSVRYGVDLTAVGGSIDADNMVSRIVPVGTDKNGNDLYLPEIYIEADGAEGFPHPRYAAIRVDGANVGSDMTKDQAFERMRDAARVLFDNGSALPDASITVEFVDRSRLVGSSDLARLQKLFPGDDVYVQIDPMGITAKMRLSEYTFDCLTQKFRTVTLGTVSRNIATTGIDPGQLPDAGVTASKLASAAVGAKQLGDGAVKSAKIENAAIETAHISKAAVNDLNAASITALTAYIHALSADSVTTDELYAAVAHVVALAADSIRAGKIDADALAAALADITVLRAGMITAETIDTDELAAAVARIVALRADTITAGSIETDELGAALAKVIALYAQVGDFDFMASQNVVAGALSVEEASADSVYITNLAVTNANLLSATLGKLVLKGTDGKYYEIVVGADGQISTREVTVSEGEIAAGETAGGRQIVETSANIGDLNAQSIKGNQAIINTILTTALTAEKITAADAMIASATIPALYATSIQAIGNSLDLRANESVKLAVGDAVDALEIGGRNLYAGTRDFSGDAWRNRGGWTEDGEWSGLTVMRKSSAWEGLFQERRLEAGTYTISAWAKCGAGSMIVAYIAQGISEGAAVAEPSDVRLGDVGQDWTRISVTFEVTAAGTAWVRFENEMDLDFRICGMKLERGGTATDWTPAPEDAEGQITAVRAELDVQKEQITAKVSREELDGVDERINGVYSEVTQRADGLEAQIVEKVDGETLRAYIRYDGENVEIGRSDSRYRTQTSDRGFVILQDGAEMTSMEQNAVTAPVLRARRTIEIGGHVLKLGSAGHLIIN